MSELTIEKLIDMCYPKRGQGLNIHSDDVKTLVAVLINSKPKVIVEIGAAYGTSSKLFAETARLNGGHLYSVDPVHRKEWDENLNEYGLCDFATFIEAASPWVNWQGPGIDFLFIDGFHNYRNVMSDFFFWQRYLNDGALIAFHDCVKYPAVKRAIEEIRKTESIDFVASSTSTTGLEIYRYDKDRHKDTVFFGPWVGEFGFEVAWWQGFCRKQSRKYKHVIVSAGEGSQGLYKDFASDIQIHGLRGNPVCGYAKNITGEFDFPTVGKVFAPPEKMFIPNDEQELIIFGQGKEVYDYDILICVNEHRRKQYPYWTDILDHFKDKKIACFGLKDSKYPDGILSGTTDLRGIPLDQLAGYMRGAKVVIGPSCGIIHYASYCVANMVVWCDSGTYTWGHTLRDRFEKILNPFNNNVEVIDQYGWVPPAEKVIYGIKRFL